jgi:hypothetical protein
MYYFEKSYSLLRELLIMNTRYAIILMKIKERDIANIEKKKTYNLYRSEISYEAERMQSYPKFPINRISV